MSKVNGTIAAYTPLREERSRTVAAYDMQPEADGIRATWHEVYFYHKRDGNPNLAAIKNAIAADINERTTDRIRTGLAWNQKPVWLSVENQMDWKAAYDLALQSDGANLPVKFKIGEQDGTPVYHTFTSVNAFGDFHVAWQQHIHQCLTDGWAMKDSIDWSVYAKALDGAPATM